jgi:hypothetical protein
MTPSCYTHNNSSPVDLKKKCWEKRSAAHGWVSITLSAAAAAATNTQITLTHANANDGSMILDRGRKKIPFCSKFFFLFFPNVST